MHLCIREAIASVLAARGMWCAAQAICSPHIHTQQQFWRLLRRVMPDGWCELVPARAWQNNGTSTSFFNSGFTWLGVQTCPSACLQLASIPGPLLGNTKRAHCRLRTGRPARPPWHARAAILAAPVCTSNHETQLNPWPGPPISQTPSCSEAGGSRLLVSPAHAVHACLDSRWVAQDTQRFSSCPPTWTWRWVYSDTTTDARACCPHIVTSAPELFCGLRAPRGYWGDVWHGGADHQGSRDDFHPRELCGLSDIWQRVGACEWGLTPSRELARCELLTGEKNVFSCYEHVRSLSLCVLAAVEMVRPLRERLTRAGAQWAKASRMSLCRWLREAGLQRPLVKHRGPCALGLCQPHPLRDR